MFDDAAKEFQENGFCVIPGFFSPERVRDVVAHLDEYIRDTLPSLPDNLAMYEDRDDPRTLMRLECLHEHDPYFRDVASEETVTSFAADLLGDDAALNSFQMFGKAPRIGVGTPAHQDGFYFCLEPCNALTFWIALDRADEENGCVHYVAGSNRKGLRRHEPSSSFGFSLGIPDLSPEDEANEKVVVVDPGDLIVHHCLTIHRTSGNPSDRLRRALGIVFFGASSDVDVEAKKAHQKSTHEMWRKLGKL
jgi:phytanoyl-CoA hydroxylase